MNFQPELGILAAAFGDGGCEGLPVLRRHHIVDYRVYRRAEIYRERCGKNLEREL